MMYYTHAAFGILVALLALDLFDFNNKILFVLIIALFAVFPDIDMPKSKIGKKNKFISTLINLLFGHRGIVHSIYIPLALFIIFYKLNLMIAIAILLGYLAHLIMDGLTKTGIIPLYPIINKKIKGFIKTNSILEKILFLVIVFVDLYLLLKYI